MDTVFNLRRLGWIETPQSGHMIASSYNPLLNASRAIAVVAYPRPKDHISGGKAERYSIALLSRVARDSRKIGSLAGLPAWAKSMRSQSMESLLETGHRNLMRAITVRNLIISAHSMRIQLDQRIRGERLTFTTQFSPDLQQMKIEIPLENTINGYILSGRVPDTKLASLRAAILYHRPALSKFEGPPTKLDGRDSEADYQNAYTRYVRPALFVQHIVDVVWAEIIKNHEKVAERAITMDDLLMRRPEWAENIHIISNQGLWSAISKMRHLGVPSCWCAMVRFAEPLPDS